MEVLVEKALLAYSPIPYVSEIAEFWPLHRFLLRHPPKMNDLYKHRRIHRHNLYIDHIVAIEAIRTNTYPYQFLISYAPSSSSAQSSEA